MHRNECTLAVAVCASPRTACWGHQLSPPTILVRVLMVRPGGKQLHLLLSHPTGLFPFPTLYTAASNRGPLCTRHTEALIPSVEGFSGMAI